MIDLRKRHLLYLLQTRPKEGKEVSMVGLSSLKRSKVAMTVYVAPEVKKGMKIAAATSGVTVSKEVEDLCMEYLKLVPEVQDLLKKGG